MQIKITIIEDQKQAVTSEFVEAPTAIEYLSKFITPLEQHAAIDEVLDEEKDEDLEATTESNTGSPITSEDNQAVPSSSQPTDESVGIPDGQVAGGAELSPEEKLG